MFQKKGGEVAQVDTPKDSGKWRILIKEAASTFKQ